MMRTIFPILLASAAPALAQSIEYRTDDGTQEGQALTSFSGMLLANYYFVEAPFDTITALTVANPATAFTSVEALIWDDPDDDGDPLDAVLLSRTRFDAPTGLFTLVEVDVPDTLVSGGFLVGILLLGDGPRTYFDRNDPGDSAWIMSGDALEPASLEAIHRPGSPANWFLRATGVEGACYADCDESGELDLFDFLCFQSDFAAGEARADCDGSGELDLFDFLCFQSAFAAGCP